MKNKKETLLILTILITICIIIFNRDKLYEAKYTEPKDTLLAITINGEISTTFPTTNAYTGTVECTTGTGKVEWNGTKWVLTTSGITKGSTKCNAIFNKKLTLAERILADNEIKTPITTPGKEVSAHTLNDAVAISVDNLSSNYYITYGTGWTANGTKFNLTGTAVTSDTYANSYSSLVGKYLPYSSLSSSGSSTAGTMVTTTNLSSVYYVISATSSSFTYKVLSSNKNTTEALLASTEDDYGTSYYFRGAVTNNYVQFANKCWRIIRVGGNGSVKLILHNDNTSNASSSCASSNNSTTAAFAKYSGSIWNTSFNSSDNDNAYIGFMYGTASSSDYASTHANLNKSEMLKNLETWYMNNLTPYEDKIADVIWCNDKSTTGTGTGYGEDNTHYRAFNRIAQNYLPTLICPKDNNNGKLSKFTVRDTINGNGNLTYKIGLLTADEVVFAGYAHIYQNDAVYLLENTGNEAWWTMSPFQNNMVFCVSYGNVTFNDFYSSAGVRPSIALNSDVTVTGSGISEDPYIVK